MELNNLTIDELVELKHQINSYIYNYEDGYFYICFVRSYGRFWKEYVSNFHALQELCYEYNGDNGILDVYSNNPNLSKLDNYGDTKFVPTKEDYENWRSFVSLENLVNEIRFDLKEWEEKKDLSFRERPLFPPTYTQENLEEYEKRLKDYDMSFVEPKDYEQETP